MQIEIWSDYACPFCYIGKTRLENAIKKTGNKDIEIIYKAYQLDPTAPEVSDLPAVDYYVKRKGWTKERTNQMFSQIEEMAKQTGLEYHLKNTVHTNTLTAHRLSKWAATFGKEGELTTRLMIAYFTESKDIANKATLLALVKELNLDVKAAEKVIDDKNAYLDVFNSQVEEARDIGVSGVPFFVINRKYGISGAQEEALFLQALNQVLEEEKTTLKSFGGDATATCDDDGCRIK